MDEDLLYLRDNILPEAIARLNARLSSETQVSNNYRGPCALRIEHAKITGKG